jgi:hypothetical protein
MLMVTTSFKKNGALGKPSPTTTSLPIKQISMFLSLCLVVTWHKPLNNNSNRCIALDGYVKLAGAFRCLYAVAYGW